MTALFEIKDVEDLLNHVFELCCVHVTRSEVELDAPLEGTHLMMDSFCWTFRRFLREKYPAIVSDSIIEHWRNSHIMLNAVLEQGSCTLGSLADLLN